MSKKESTIESSEKEPRISCSRYYMKDILENDMDALKKTLTVRLQELNLDHDQIDIIIERILAGDKDTVKLLLRRHRKQLMDILHESGKRVDDLDLLMYQIEKNKLSTGKFPDIKKERKR